MEILQFVLTISLGYFAGLFAGYMLGRHQYVHLLEQSGDEPLFVVNQKGQLISEIRRKNDDPQRRKKTV